MKSLKDECVIVGGGDVDKTLPLLKYYKGTIISTSTAWKWCIEMGLEPDYVMSVENNDRPVYEHLFPKTKVGHAKLYFSFGRTPPWIIKEMKDLGYETLVHPIETGNYLDNGAFTCRVAFDVLKFKRIGLIGYNHVIVRDTDKRGDFEWQSMIDSFNLFMERVPEDTVFNCTGGGILSNPKVKDMPLAEFIKSDVIAVPV